MNQRIKELWEKATTIEYGVDNGFDRVTFNKEKFAELVRADEREACAKLVEDAAGTGKIISCISAAAAIRARSNT